MEKLKHLRLVCAVLLLGGSLNTQANDLSKAISEGTSKLSLRYRFEGVDQTGFAEDAGASTLRARFTWTSAPINGVTTGIEVDHVSAILSSDYNSTTNGNTTFPVVADPEGLDLNQAYVKYKGSDWTGTAGRQRVLHGTQRFIGGVGWRQNEQTYDALRAEWKPSNKLAVDYGYIWNVNRIFGPDGGAQPSDWRGNTHYVTSSLDLSDTSKLGAFVYLMSFENDNGIPNSTSTYGIDYRGTYGPLSLAMTLATQSDYGDSNLSYDADYYLLEAAWQVKGYTLTGGLEVLGSDGMVGFKTPLATLHKFQGWADKFLVTPANGIQDIYVGVKGKVGPVALNLTWHDFAADTGGADYGTELNLSGNWSLNDSVSFQLKLADYQSDGFATDTTKYWVSMMVNL